MDPSSPLKTPNQEDLIRIVEIGSSPERMKEKNQVLNVPRKRKFPFVSEYDKSASESSYSDKSPENLGFNDQINQSPQMIKSKKFLIQDDDIEDDPNKFKSSTRLQKYYLYNSQRTELYEVEVYKDRELGNPVIIQDCYKKGEINNTDDELLAMGIYEAKKNLVDGLNSLVGEEKNENIMMQAWDFIKNKFQ